jgi:hypothetical protein
MSDGISNDMRIIYRHAILREYRMRMHAARGQEKGKKASVVNGLNKPDLIASRMK